MNKLIDIINEISSDTIIFINESGGNEGEIKISKALDQAKDKNLDLVIVNEKANPPVCKLMDFGKHTYKKKIAEKKSKSKVIKTKEIRINTGISNNDLETKIKSIEKFLSKENHVRLVLRSKDRRNSSSYLNNMENYMKEILSIIKTPFEVEGSPNFSDNQYSIKICPN